MKLKMFVLIGLLSMLLVSGLSCDGVEPTTYQLTTVVEGQGNVSPNSGTFHYGERITLTAIPASGWSFSHWGGQGSGSQYIINIMMDSDKTVYAYFIEETLEPTTTSSGSELLAPQLLSPDVAECLLIRRPIFQWTAIGWADKYDIQVATDTSFSEASLVINVYLGNMQAYMAPADLANGTYYWHVMAKNDSTQTPWSSMSTFTVAQPIPSD